LDNALGLTATVSEYLSVSVLIFYIKFDSIHLKKIGADDAKWEMIGYGN
jgi:hypothetical protein